MVLDVSLGYPWGVPDLSLDRDGCGPASQTLSWADQDIDMNEFLLTSFKVHVSRQKAKDIPQELEDCKVGTL